MATAAGPSGTTPAPFHGGGKGRFAQNQAKYGQPLPLILPSSSEAGPSTTTSYLASLIPSFGTRRPAHEQVAQRQCIGTLDPLTKSVWVTNRQDVEYLFQKGFFGKGTLSRSDPTWRARRIDLVKGGSSAKAEQIRAKRREERKQFKVDRAAAMLDAAKAAEALIVAAKSGADGSEAPDASTPAEGGTPENVEDHLAALDGSASPAPSTLSLPASSSAEVDISTLTPQTFLVRPTRPDANRNRGKNAFKRKPKPKPSAAAADAAASGAAESTSAQMQTAQRVPSIRNVEVEEDEGSDEDPFDEDIVQEMEHLQLALEEAWFLATAIGALKVYDPTSDIFIPPSALLSHLLTPSPTAGPASSVPHKLLPDDPFLVSYVSYHHFRSLGWVVKPGIKFSCDWLLYRKGPVFSHSAFACVVIPVYEDQEERVNSMHGQTDWYEERASWKWVNTVMRVNSLVQKTVILVYVTIPSLSSFRSTHRLADGSLSLDKNDMRSLLPRYTVRESALTRFGPARRRD